MLQIDRVKAQMDVLPTNDASSTRDAGDVQRGVPLSDPALKERLRPVVLEILRDHFRELERRGGL